MNLFLHNDPNHPGLASTLVFSFAMNIISIKHFFALLKKTHTAWDADKVPRLAAALSYYTIFSLAPVLLVAIASAGAIWGREAVQGRVLEQISELIGKDGDKASWS